ncbi:MAG TPA: LacI family DNA-binding transcriptional regulator, partial [Microbacterium sp.]|nr:LacI family DNA-binding transcriptional regulator [Microbacterium sp.]
MTSRRATISDVAREAAVSPSTASVVFSGKTPVSDATRQRVLDAAASLGYTGPDPRAASLRRGRSGIVGVVVGSSLNYLFLDPVQRLMMDGLAEAVAPFGAGLLLLRTSTDIENAP